jgi:DNA repair exonuclease SbcCD ATPase subunit
MSYQSAKFEDIDHSGLTLIEGINQDEGGSNGSGKSSLWDGISWALFGSTVRGLKSDEVINRHIKKDCEVHLYLTSGEKNYIVRRYRSHNKFSDRLILDFANEHWEVTGSKEMGTLARTQEYIVKTFGIDFELFRCTVLFAQGETFDFINAGNKAQKEILSKVMKIDYDSHLEKAKAKHKELSQEYNSIIKDMAILRSHLIEDPDELYADDIAKWDLDYQRKIQESERDLANKIRSKSDLPSTDSTRLEEMRVKLAGESSKLQYRLSCSRQKISEAEGDIRLLNMRKNEISSLIRKGSCPTCRQAIDEAVSTKGIAEIQAEIDKIASELEEHRSKSDAIDELIKTSTERMDRINNAIHAISATRKIESHLDSEIKRLTDNIERMSKETNPFIAKRDEAIAKQNKIREKIDAFDIKTKQIEENLPYYDFWVSAFGDAGIKSFVFDLICSTLTSKSNDYLNILTGGTIAVSFDTQKKLKTGELREKFDCSVMRDGETVKYEAYSGGEKRRISLAVDMALSDLMSDYHGSRFNMVVFDEQTNYLDLQGRQGFMELLKKLAMKKRVFVVDHDSEFKAQFDDVWTIQKRDGISRFLA